MFFGKNLVLKHPEGSEEHAWPLFLDSSSAGQTIQAYFLVDKLVNNFNLDYNVIGWILLTV